VTPLVVDASVAIKWLLPELHSTSARRVLAEDTTLFAPDLLWAELWDALWERVRAGEMAAEDARDLLRDFRRFPVATTPVLVLIGSALEIDTQLDRTVDDSLYLALALGRRCRLVTADRRLYNALKGGPLTSTLVWVEEVP
jgi:predicted nucleic acid-binding protein